MGPTIILDKSALQALSRDELVLLHRYYLVNTVPILVVEILGDLKKPIPNSLSADEVMRLAKKIFPHSSHQNAHFRDLLIGSLLGYEPEMDGRPNVSHGKQVVTDKGEHGSIIEETPEEKALLRWKEGSFTGAEELLAQRWRQSTRHFDLELMQKNLRELFARWPKLNTLVKVAGFVDQLLKTSGNQLALLKMIPYEFDLDSDLASRVFLRWETEDKKPLQIFSPYATYCLKVNLFFKLGLANRLIGTRATNRVDLEYLYYLPFCNVFTSNDKFHGITAKHFLNEGQTFIEFEILKDDLKAIQEILSTIQDSRQLTVGPPENAESITSRLWDKFMKPGARKWPLVRPDVPEELRDKVKNFEQALVEIIKEKNRAKPRPGDPRQFDKSDEGFIIKRRTILGSDPCICSSGIAFMDCCGRNLKPDG